VFQVEAGRTRVFQSGLKTNGCAMINCACGILAKVTSSER
jgi:hypothetical protein